VFDQNNNTSLVAANEVLNADNEAIGVTLFNMALSNSQLNDYIFNKIKQTIQ